MKLITDRAKILAVIVTLSLGLILSFQAIRMNTEAISQSVPVPSVGLRAVWLNDKGTNETILVTGENSTHYFVEMYGDGISLGVMDISKSVYINHSYSWSYFPDFGWPCWINVTDLNLFDQILLGPESFTIVDKAVITIDLGSFEVWMANASLDDRSYLYETGTGLLIAYMFGSGTTTDFHFLDSTNAQFGQPTQTTDSSTTGIWTTEYPTTTEIGTTEYTETTVAWTTEEPATTETGPFPSLCEEDPPEVSITGIEDDGTYSGTITIEFSVTDENEIEKVEININNGDIDETDEIDLDLIIGTWTGSYDLDTTDFPDGTYDVTIKVYDTCDNVKTLRLDVTFENGITSGKIPDVTPGFEGISAFLSLGAIVAVLWRRRRRK